MARTSKTMASKPKPQTTAQSLGSLLKSARDIMRKDKGLNGDLDRLPLLTWIMFLKFLDDLEIQREEEAALAGGKFRPAIEPPYRWRDWAARADGITGDELLSFINQDKCVLPDGKKGVGLFAYLRGLTSSNGDNRRDVIATVFRGVDNRMKSGYLLRDIINKVNEIHFTSSEELHTLGALYESMLREMRDAAGDSGEFYTPRAVVRFMVEVTNPRLGETVLDPACGTGGFLVEAFNHLSKQVKTVADRKTLQTRSLFGCEAKSLPYLLSQMNLLLHGLNAPQIDPGNALRFKLTEIGEKDRVNVILTNPPFGGEEEKGIQDNFSDDKRTSETTLLFLQLIMRKLQRNSSCFGTARAAVIVPNGTLYEEGAPQRIREELINGFNLHTIIKFPKGVFEPYTDIATNILFFERGKSTQQIWYYEHPLPPHREHLKGKCYSATDGIRYEEFAPLLEWWHNRTENDHAWLVNASALRESGYDLVQNHPRHAKVTLPAPNQIIGTIRQIKDNSEKALRRLEKTLVSLQNISAPAVPLRELLRQRSETISIDSSVKYTRPRVQLHFRGARVRDQAMGYDIGTKKQTLIRTNDLIVSRIDARNGAMAIVPSELDGAIATNDFPVFEIVTERVLPSYLRYCLFQPSMRKIYEHLSRGSTNRRRLIVERFLDLEIPIPPTLESQLQVADTLSKCESGIAQLHEQFGGMEEELANLVGAALHYVFENSSKALREQEQEYKTVLSISAQHTQSDIQANVAKAGLSTNEYLSAEATEFQSTTLLHNNVSRRIAIACYTVNRLHQSPTFGRTQLMKSLFVVEAYIGIDLHGDYERQAAGPFDRKIYDLEKEAKKQKWFEVQETKTRKGYTQIRYLPLPGLQSKVDEAVAILGEKRQEFDRLLSLFKQLSTEEAEIIATLYAAWNDELLRQSSPTEDQIIQEVLENWHERKKRFSQQDLQTWLKWMKENQLTPKGVGPKTVPTNCRQSQNELF